MRFKKYINRNVILLAVAALLVVAAIIASGPAPHPSASNYERLLEEVQP